MVDNKEIHENGDNIFQTTENIDSYIKDLDPNDPLARVSLEYALCSSKRDMVDYLIKKLSTYGDDVSKEWARIYEIDHLVTTKKMSLTESINKLTHTQCISKEMSILRKIFQLYNYYDLKAFQMIEIMSGLIQEEINLLDNSYMKDSLQSRVNLAMQSMHAHLNQLEKSRVFGHNLRQIAPTPNLMAIAYKNLGATYILEDYTTSIDYYEKAKKIMEKQQNKTIVYDIQVMINFIHCYWNNGSKALWLRKETPDEMQTFAFYLIKNSEKQKALNILDNVQDKLENNFQLGYHHFYRGLITKSEADFYESVKFFNKLGDYFFRQLPLLELKEMGVDAKVLSALSV